MAAPNLDLVEKFWIPLGLMLIGSGGGALITWLIRAMGKNSKIGPRIEKVETRLDHTDQAVVVLLSVTSHQTAGIRAVVEANREALNGTYEKVIERMDAAETESQGFLREAYGGKKS
jgi:hypothetical protein